MPIPIRSDAMADVEPAVRAAIVHADRVAGRDNRKFVHSLHLHVRKAAQQAQRNAGVIPIRAAPAATRSFQMYDDPRHFANARELSRRTMGGASGGRSG